MQIVGPEADLDVRVDAYATDSMTIARIGHGTEVVIAPGTLDSYYEINIPLAGSTGSVWGDEELTSDASVAAVFAPHRDSLMHWSADCRQLAVKISRELLDSTVEQLTGRTPDEIVEFDLAFDVATPAGRAWVATVELLSESIELASPDFVLRPLEELVVSRLLVAAPNTFAGRIAGEARPPRPRMVRRVTDLIEAEPGGAHTASSLAAVAGVSVRSLQAAFAEHLGLAPMDYVRRVRLSRCRVALQTAEPGDGQTVADIAFRYGFSHLPRFAAAYRKRYGENPSETLRRF
ncbi:hypothetical protein ACH46_18240 [Gordonia phthalatica]|uniref:HTH araC/xylS-type domain-containing protein n=2 Tax=Gordonia phthalatica TaxID=1136941 RepID=A0A0N9MSK3_9ACTN|nr:hypothetical protein ACH46_18240 [Gordonia phthalatica]